MTRKRFVKLVMSNGYSKRKANKIASMYVKQYGSYEEGYLAYVEDSIKTFGKIVDKLREFLQKPYQMFLGAY